MKFAIQTQQISKVYKPSGSWYQRVEKDPVTAVNNVSLEIPEGELFGLLGPNGAGKTTLVKMLCTLILPSSGTASISGINLREERKIRALTGLVVSDERSFFWRLSIKRNLDFFAALVGLHGSEAGAQIDAVLEGVDLKDRKHQRFSDLSSGMRQRLAIARALIHEPKILFLDEPTRSLDPIATQQLHDLILRVISERKMTVFLITHDLIEAEKLCDRVALMHEAQIQQVGPPEILRRHLSPQRTYTITVGPISKAYIQDLQNITAGLTCTGGTPSTPDTIIQFVTAGQNQELTNVIDSLRQNKVEILSIDGSLPSLEDVFTHFTLGQIGE